MGRIPFLHNLFLRSWQSYPLSASNSFGQDRGLLLVPNTRTLAISLITWARSLSTADVVITAKGIPDPSVNK